MRVNCLATMKNHAAQRRLANAWWQERGEQRATILERPPIKAKVKTISPLMPPCGGSPSCMPRFGGRPVCPRLLVAWPSPRILRTFQNLRTPLSVFAPRHLSEARKPLFEKSRRLWFRRGLWGLGAYPESDPHAQRTCGIGLSQRLPEAARSAYEERRIGHRDCEFPGLLP